MKGLTGLVTPGQTFEVVDRQDLPAVNAYAYIRQYLVFMRTCFDFPKSGREFLFPLLSQNGRLQPDKPIGHAQVQDWLTSFTTARNLPFTLTTHSCRRGAPQFWFIHAPTHMRWSLQKVHWWGGWADGEQVIFSFLSILFAAAGLTHIILQQNTVIKYLLDDVSRIEGSYSDALFPIQTCKDADSSFAGVQTQQEPVSVTLDILERMMSGFQSLLSRELSSGLQAIRQDVLSHLQHCRSLEGVVMVE